jgi:hypothetical protein
MGYIEPPMTDASQRQWSGILTCSHAQATELTLCRDRFPETSKPEDKLAEKAPNTLGLKSTGRDPSSGTVAAASGLPAADGTMHGNCRLS